MTIRLLSILIFCLAVTACGTTDSTMREQGKPDAYVIGFHDGRHSGMQEEGNFIEHFIRDHERFENDEDYRSGWLAGEAEGKKLQRQATTAGNAAVGIYSGYQVGKEVDRQTDFDRIGRETVEGMDTSDLKNLEQD